MSARKKKERSVARGDLQAQNPFVRLFRSLIRPTVPRFRRTLDTATITPLKLPEIGTTITPLKLPEIRTTIGRFLGRSDLVQCLYVCRAWYASFLPLVWSTVSILRSKGRYPEVEAFNSHNHLIRKLEYDFWAWRAYKSTHCRNVSTLRVRCEYSVHVVIAQYDQLRQLSIIGTRTSEYGNTRWEPTNSFRNLSSLELEMVDIKGSTNNFWNLCTGLESLSIHRMNIPHLPDKSIIFERLEKLKLWPLSGDVCKRRVEFITQCPNLVSLDWGRAVGDEPASVASVDMFASQLAKGTWPRLCELRIPSSISSDKQLAQIVHGMRQVKSLDVQGCWFGPLTLTAFRQHFSGLRQLKLEYTGHTEIGPSNVHEVLASCPQLEILIAGEVTSEELLQDQSWACEHTLKTLHMCIILSPCEDMDRHQQLVLEKISRCSHLEDFGLLLSAPSRDATYINATLGKGLEHLANLKKLRRLGLNSCSNRMTKADVEWILDNLKNLECVRGFLDNMSLSAMIRAKGIQFDTAEKCWVALTLKAPCDNRNPDDPIPPTEALADNHNWKAGLDGLIS
ncbi:MAG: hypothetical protein J3Q66DRAFT_441873 [Benniella sp.]|nr:MAG: hypothetical protein J3Q66DRAFT_441873 [Benniella sp.]